MKEPSVAELAFCLDPLEFFEPEVEIEHARCFGFLDLSQRLNRGTAKLADVIRIDAAAKYRLQLVDMKNFESQQIDSHARRRTGSSLAIHEFGEVNRTRGCKFEMGNQIDVRLLGGSPGV